jgi:hypothetical protein
MLARSIPVAKANCEPPCHPLVGAGRWVREMRTRWKRNQNFPWEQESVVIASTKSISSFAGLFPNRNIDSHVLLAPWHMI